MNSFEMSHASTTPRKSYSGEEAKIDEPNLVTVVKELIDEIRTINSAIEGYHQIYFGGEAIKALTEKPSTLSPARHLIEQVETAKGSLRAARGNLDDILKVVGL